MPAKGHLYKKGAKRGELRKFENRYGKKKGKRVYGAVVGKVYRETHEGKNWNTGKRYCLKCSTGYGVHTH